MSNAPRRSQPAYLSAAFEITSEGPGSQSSQAGYQTVTSGLNCTGIDGSSPFEHPILISSYSSAGAGLSVGEIYVLKVKLLTSNTPRIPHGLHELSHHIHAGSAETFPGNLINNVAISSIGVIVERRTVQESSHGGRPTTFCIIRHTDWDPMAGENAEFHIEYWCRPVHNLVKVMNLFQKGREVTINGYVTGNDRTRHILQVDVYAVSVATGHENVNTPSTFGGTAQSKTTKAGRVRLPRPDDVPSSSGSTASSEQSTSQFPMSDPLPNFHARNPATTLPDPVTTQESSQPSPSAGKAASTKRSRAA